MDSNEIDALVEDYQERKPGAAEQLLELFQPLLLKYVSLIKDGNVDTNDKFIKLFMDKEARRRYKYQPAVEIEKVTGILRWLTYSLTREDLYNELVVVFLETCDRYKRKGVGFTGYLNKVFKYALYRRLTSYISDPANGAETTDSVNIEAPAPEPPEIDALWINGTTPSPPFDKLTSVDRMVLYKRYKEGKSTIDISEETGISRASIYSIIGRSKKYLRQIIDV